MTHYGVIHNHLSTQFYGLYTMKSRMFCQGQYLQVKLGLLCNGLHMYIYCFIFKAYLFFFQLVDVVI